MFLKSFQRLLLGENRRFFAKRRNRTNDGRKSGFLWWSSTTISHLRKFERRQIYCRRHFCIGRRNVYEDGVDWFRPRRKRRTGRNGMAFDDWSPRKGKAAADWSKGEKRGSVSFAGCWRAMGRWMRGRSEVDSGAKANMKRKTEDCC